MKTRKRMTVFILTISSFLIIIFTSLKYDQGNAVFKNPCFLSAAGRSGSMQEKTKYFYVGAEKCASVCHNNEDMGFQYNIWKESLHSEAFKKLTSKRAVRYGRNAGIKGNLRESTVCLECHITGGGLDSSFFADTYRKEDGITCESCHKGDYITKTFLPKESDCLKCHNNSVHKTQKFVFDERCAKITHPRPKSKSEGV
jgi:hypothetical protein